MMLVLYVRMNFTAKMITCKIQGVQSEDDNMRGELLLLFSEDVEGLDSDRRSDAGSSDAQVGEQVDKNRPRGDTE